MARLLIYMLASGRKGTLYVGVTSNLDQRVAKRREGAMPGFTQRQGSRRGMA
jgi:putative endonuclease